MEMLFGDICSANIFQADKELHAELGIKDVEADESQRSTPSPPRKSRSPTPRPVETVLTIARTEQSARPEANKANISRSSSSTVRLETPHKRAKTSRSGHSSTPSSTKSDKDVRKEAMFHAALNQKWEKGFFTSVDGYHNQEPEKEL
jgi:DNA cross-link repair 1C protein